MSFKKCDLWCVLAYGVLRFYDQKHSGTMRMSTSVSNLKAVSMRGDTTLVMEFLDGVTPTLSFHNAKDHVTSPSLPQWAATLLRLLEGSRTGYLLCPLIVADVSSVTLPHSPSTQSHRRCEIVSIHPLKDSIWCVTADFHVSEWKVHNEMCDTLHLECLRAMQIDQIELSAALSDAIRESAIIEDCLWLSAGNAVGTMPTSLECPFEVSWCPLEDRHTSQIRSMTTVTRSSSIQEVWTLADFSIHIWQVGPNGSRESLAHVIKFQNPLSIHVALQVCASLSLL